MASTETLDDLLADVIRSRRFTSWCVAAGLQPYTVLRLRQGIGTPHRGTILALARKLMLPEARVRAAIEASRAARG